MALLEARNISKTFPRAAVPALQDIDLNLDRGESVGIVGESGSGKTTLARTLLGLERPTTGAITYEGQPIPSGGRPWRRSRRDLQMIPQHAAGALNPRVSIRGHLEEVIRAHRLTPRAGARALIDDRLHEVHLDPRHADSYPRQLSGGQQQRAMIARGLLLEPAVLACDEPTSALDALVQGEIIDLLAARCVAPGRLFVIITHDLRVAARLCDRIIVMRHGRIVEDRRTVLVLDTPEHPYTRELLDAAANPALVADS